MAEPTTKFCMKANPNNFVIPSLLQKALIFLLFAFVLPRIPSQAPEFITSQTILNTGFELVYLLLIGITVSYGLFSSRKNTNLLPMKETRRTETHNSDLYSSQILPILDQEEEGDGEEDGEVQQVWRKQYNPNEPLLVISKDKGETIDKPLFLPVRSLNSRSQGSSKVENSSVLPSPIPWRSRSGRMEPKDESNSSKIRSLHSSSSPSPKGLSASPSLSLSSETSTKKKNLFKEIASLPPVPPPRPPPFHSDRKIKSTVKKCFKDELMDMSMRNRARDFVGNSSNLPRQKKNSVDGFSSSSYSMATDELKDATIRSTENFSSSKQTQRKNSMDGPSRSHSMANDELKEENMRIKEDVVFPKSVRPRNSFDGSNSSSIAKSVCAVRPKEVQNDLVNKVSMELFFISSENEETDSSGSERGETEYDEYSDKEMMAEEEEQAKKKIGDINEENEVDKKADEFIAKFREQIRLQRIESIKRSAGQRAVRSHKKNSNS